MNSTKGWAMHAQGHTRDDVTADPDLTVVPPTVAICTMDASGKVRYGGNPKAIYDLQVAVAGQLYGED
jgi:hypothetical protein